MRSRGTSMLLRSLHWFMLQRIRHAMHTRTFNKLSGQIEADETFIGAKSRNMHAAKRAEKIHGRGPDGKAIVMGVLERGGEVRARSFLPGVRVMFKSMSASMF